MKWFRPADPYRHVIDFIDAATESEELSGWLARLEQEPENMRCIRLAEIRSRMTHDGVPAQHIEIIDLLENAEVLTAMNRVLREIDAAGMSLSGLIRKKQCASYQALISLLPTP